MLQYSALLLLLVVTGFMAVFNGTAASTPELNWLNPFAVPFRRRLKAFLLCVFLYWGWDAVLAVNEETKDPEKTPGRAALIATVILAGTTLVTRCFRWSHSSPSGHGNWARTRTTSTTSSRVTT